MVEENFDETTKSSNSYHVTYLNLGSLLYSIIFYFVDVGFDFYLAYAYFTTGKYSYFAWTVSFILLPSVIITLLSVRMYVEDCKGSARYKYSVLRIVFCILGIFLQSAPFIRYCDSLKYAIKSLKAELHSDKKLQEKYFNKMLNENSDVALLRVFECYLESAPQQVLQATLLLIDYSQNYSVHTTKQFITIVLGFVTMGWCMADYHRSIRIDQEDKQNMSVLGTVVQFFWHLNFTVSRILAISALATLYPFWTCIAIASHWCIMTIWIAISSKTNFCGNKIFEIFFSGAVGLIYIFNFLSLKDGPTRNSYLVYYLLCLIENLIAVAIWGLRSTFMMKNWVYYVFTVFPIVCFILSVLLLIVYYKFLHPNKCKSRVKNDKKVFYGKTVLKNTCEQRVILSNEK